MERIETYIENWLTSSGISEETAIYLRLFILSSALIVIAVVTFWVIRKIILHYVYKLVKRSKATWDDLLADHKVLNYAAHLVPAVFIMKSAHIIFRDFDYMLPAITKITDIYLIFVIASIVLAFLKVGEFTLSQREAFKDKPLSSYFQLIRILLYITIAILVLSIILGKSPIYLLSAFGAMTAILMLVFKDTILGLVASVQMSANDMVKVGDWVEMPKFNADGDVIAINLHTVKVRNWDKTITTIPTYYFITDSFKNWRGMVESGGRRIKRSIYINTQTIRFVSPEMRELYKKYQLITRYIEERQKEIENHNLQTGVDTSHLINGRRMTNIGVFRKYVEVYLKQHPGIKKDMTIMVRQLAIEDKGVPLEIYCFTNTTAWLEYESIQADIFDHLFSAIRFFDLEIFQQPSGSDIKAAIQSAISR